MRASEISHPNKELSFLRGQREPDQKLEQRRRREDRKIGTGVDQKTL
jgi:hypothetical protein